MRLPPPQLKASQDSHTARFLLDRLFFGPLLEHRTVVSEKPAPETFKN